ncbi:hypothetical protein N480_13640 [Pseudoalteromonas luteoviolacea S2607]|uniref:hypothetical protein n=1 Tax=Pseudoalteromonas luteoviolacea TaxID=43657 RepID=UPI0007B0A9F8|nr:hypothetical protein [Pseudoalteromonas luteoviolacea]KZN38692.1 hypothetical protein N480_13640 [Pseudoalteromonas luteoviolacea S2607]
MSIDYKIYLVNESASGKNLWCFLSEPEGLNKKSVYANSSTGIFVEPNYLGLNYFVIPYKYALQAGASNNAVQANTKIESSIESTISIDVELGKVYDTQYATAPPKKGPNLTVNQSDSSPTGTLQIQTNSFDKVENEEQRWFENATFGIEMSNGFIGSTWAPAPNEATTITPQFKFYITTGSFEPGTLTDFSIISKNAAVVNLSDFNSLEVTVTLTSEGTFLVTPGQPEQSSTSINKLGVIEHYSKLVNTHNQLVEKHAETIYSHHQALSKLFSARMF